jgi:hypothetical protein
MREASDRRRTLRNAILRALRELPKREGRGIKEAAVLRRVAMTNPKLQFSYHEFLEALLSSKKITAKYVGDDEGGDEILLDAAETCRPAG